MKKIMLSALLLSATCTFAQSENNWNWDWDFDQTMYNPIPYTPKNQVDEINFTVQKKNGKIEKFQKKYNSDGRLLEYSTFNKENEKVPVVKYQYDANNWVVSAQSYKHGKLHSEISKTRLDKDKPLEVIKKNGKHKIIYKKTWEYNEDQCVTKSEQYKKKGKLYRVWEYEYFSACEKSRSVLKNGKCKVLSTWNYECKDEGDKSVPQKHELQVCKYEESTKGYLIKVLERTNSKGKVYRTIQKFTLTDTLIVESKSLDSEGRLTRFATYDHDFKKVLINKNFRKGKLRYWNEYTYENGNVVSHTSHFKNNVRYTYKYQYQDNKMVERTQINKKNKLVKKISLSYS